MRRLLLAGTILALLLPASAARAVEGAERWVRGGFEMTGFLTTGVGWQRFSNDPVTANYGGGGGYPGVLGDVLPNITTGTPPAPGQDTAEFFVERFEFDLIKRINDRARLRADIYFGRAASGSTVATTTLEHAYAAVRLSRDHNVELAFGRIGLVTGFESYEYYYNDTISLSILSRAPLYPGPITGVLISAALTDMITVFGGVGNSTTGDTIFRVADVPNALGILEVDWGPEHRQSYLAFTTYVGPEPDSNRHLTFGANFDLGWWFARSWELGFEALYKGFRGGGNPRADYVAGLANLHWDLNRTRSWFSFLKYAAARQFQLGGVNNNLTGAKQTIHEMSIGAGHFIADGVKLTSEFRFDIIDPDGARAQTVPGIAFSMNCHF